jgi:uncharacterized protein YcbK (DUF882 family)
VWRCGPVLGLHPEPGICRGKEILLAGKIPGLLQHAHRRRTGEVKAIDTRLLDLAHDLGERLGDRGPFHVISGYRSPQTNALLRASGHGVARNSLHLKGEALDIRLPGTNLPVLRRAALDLKGGGVGYYPGQDFVHIDVGRVRYW